MNFLRATLANTTRIVHIALWLTIPTTFWLWLGQAPPPQPRPCEPYCGWYQGNVLGVSEDAHLFMVFGLFLLGLTVFGLWIAGYSFEIIRRVLLGDNSLPPVRLSVFREGLRLFCASLGFWLPALVTFVAALLIVGIFPYRIGNAATTALLWLALAPVAVTLFWGNLVGIARYAATGESSLMCRRMENTWLALKNLGVSLVLSMLLIVVSVTSLAVSASLFASIYDIQVPDLVTEAALGAFAFYFVALWHCVVCSHLVAEYAEQLFFRDHLRASARQR